MRFFNILSRVSHLLPIDNSRDRRFFDLSSARSPLGRRLRVLEDVSLWELVSEEVRPLLTEAEVEAAIRSSKRTSDFGEVL
jgi:hypothetical protein